MTDRPIIFSSAMILALLDGRKTMTRRLLWRSVPRGFVATGVLAHDAEGKDRRPRRLATSWWSIKQGDRLWVRETWAKHPYFVDGVPCAPLYRADPTYRDMKPGDFGWSWRPSIYMPRWASRLTLTVLSVQVERLHDITEDDARAEGVGWVVAPFGENGTAMWNGSFRAAFGGLWNRLHGAGAWEANPEVVAVSFTVKRENIDARRA